MTIVETIEELISRWVSQGGEPSGIILSTDMYRRILQEFSGQASAPAIGYNSLQFYSGYGVVFIKHDISLPIGAITLDGKSADDINATFKLQITWRRLYEKSTSN